MTGNPIMSVAVLIFLMLSACGMSTSYADIAVTSTVTPGKVSLNDYVEVTISVSGTDARKASAPVLDATPEFINLGVSTEMQTSIVNFDITITRRYIYTFKPTKIGTYKLGGATVKVGGTDYRTNPQNVEVLAGGTPPQQGQPAPGRNDGSGSQSGQNGDGNIFIESFVDNREPYVGEQITHTFELYYRLALIHDTEYSPPSTTGFWSVDLPSIDPSTKVVNGSIYNYTAIKKALFPTTSGELTIGQTVLKYAEGGFLSPSRARMLIAEPITLNVKPLPVKGKPADFTGAVGSFTVASECDKTTVKVGDVVTVKVTVTGKGNLDLISILNTPNFSAFKTYDPRVSSSLLNSGFVVGGAKTWEYVLSPRYQGEITLEPFSLSFFDPADESYRTISTEPVVLKVIPGDATAFSRSTREISQSAFENIASDIRYLKPEKKLLGDAKRRIYTNPFFYLIYILSGGIFATAFMVKRRHDSIERNTGLKRRLTAWKTAQKLIAEADKLSPDASMGKFSGKLTDAVTGYIGDMLNIGASSLTTSSIEQTLADKGVSAEIATRVRRMLELSDFVRFSSDAASTGMHKNLLDETRDILDTLKDVFNGSTRVTS